MVFPLKSTPFFTSVTSDRVPCVLLCLAVAPGPGQRERAPLPGADEADAAAGDAAQGHPADHVVGRVEADLEADLGINHSFIYS